MPFEMTVGLFVADHEKYAQYRAEIAPLLEAAGGSKVRAAEYLAEEFAGVNSAEAARTVSQQISALTV